MREKNIRTGSRRKGRTEEKRTRGGDQERAADSSDAGSGRLDWLRAEGRRIESDVPSTRILEAGPPLSHGHRHRRHHHVGRDVAIWTSHRHAMTSRWKFIETLAETEEKSRPLPADPSPFSRRKRLARESEQQPVRWPSILQ